MGVIIQKKDGGYLYTTTDIACAKYRYETLHADRVLYYIDSRQHQHLMQARPLCAKPVMCRIPFRWNTTCSA